MHLHFWFRVYICVSFLVCWLFTCWCKRRIVHRSSIFLYVHLHSVNIGVQVVASLGAMRSNECSGNRSRLQPGSGSRWRIACQCDTCERKREKAHAGKPEWWWKGTVNIKQSNRWTGANCKHFSLIFLASFCVDRWPRLCGVYLKSIYPLLCACMCLFLCTGCCVGQRHDCFEDACVFHCFFVLSILMFSLRSRKRHGFMPAFSCLSSGKMEAMAPERHFIWQALTVAGWVQVLILLSSILILCRDGDCIVHSNSIPSLSITDSGWGPWWCECAGKLLAVDFGLDLLKPLG